MILICFDFMQPFVCGKRLTKGEAERVVQNTNYEVYGLTDW